MANKPKRKSKTQRQRKKAEKAVSVSTGNTVQIIKAEQSGFRKSALTYVRANIRSLAVWSMILLSVAVLWQFSAQTGGTFSSDDQYELAFDHKPSLSELEPTLKKYELEARDVKIKGGNTIQFTATKNEEKRLAFIADAQKLPGIINAQGFSRRAVRPHELYQVKFVLAGMVAALVSALVIFFVYRKDLGSGVKLYRTFWLLTIIFSLGVAALGVVVSKASVELALDKPFALNEVTFNLYSVTVLVWSLTIMYGLIDDTFREFLVELLFKPERN